MQTINGSEIDEATMPYCVIPKAAVGGKKAMCSEPKTCNVKVCYFRDNIDKVKIEKNDSFSTTLENCGMGDEKHNNRKEED